MDNIGFQRLLQKNVIECYFGRRHIKEGWSNTRGALVTTSKPILNSINGLQALGFVPPNGIGMGYDPLAINCVVAWDIFKGAYRVFSFDQGANIINMYPVNNKVNQLKFWNYFTDFVLKLSAQEKLKFMGYLGAM